MVLVRFRCGVSCCYSCLVMNGVSGCSRCSSVFSMYSRVWWVFLVFVVLVLFSVGLFSFRN